MSLFINFLSWDSIQEHDAQITNFKTFINYLSSIFFSSKTESPKMRENPVPEKKFKPEQKIDEYETSLLMLNILIYFPPANVKSNYFAWKFHFYFSFYLNIGQFDIIIEKWLVKKYKVDILMTSLSGKMLYKKAIYSGAKSNIFQIFDVAKISYYHLAYH